MTQISDFSPSKSPEGRIGLEIEVEGLKDMPIVQKNGWTSKGDHSLRHHGIEYIFEEPLSPDQAKVGIDYLCGILAKAPVVKDSPRTSVHVHLNVGKESILQYWTGNVAYWLLENCLFKFCGEEYREGNAFCLRLKDAEGVLKFVLMDLETNPLRYLRTDHIRYCGLNLAATYKYGSVEFRGMRGTTDPNEIWDWIEILDQIRTRSQQAFKDPKELLDSFYREGAEKICSTLLETKYCDRIKEIPDWKDLIDENVSRLLRLVYKTDWDKLEKKYEKKTDKAKGFAPDQFFVDELLQPLPVPGGHFAIRAPAPIRRRNPI